MVSRRLNPLVEAELASVNWSSLRIIQGRDPARIPDAVRRLLLADTEATAEEAYWELDNRVVVQGQLFEAAKYVVPVLLAGLAGRLSTPARRAVADLLVEICSGAPDASEVALGENQLDQECRAVAREGLWLLYGLLLDADGRVREWALQTIDAVDNDRARRARTLRRLAADDADEGVRRSARQLLAGLDSEPV